jgi:hypothetical protein
MFDAGINPEMYQIQGKAFNYPDMTTELCPQCKGDYLRKHGFYGRYLITTGFEGEIIIRRYYCQECRKTVSLLPSFCHPKRTYGILVIIGLMAEFYVKMTAACLAVINFLASTRVECTRQLLLHYRRRIEKNLNSLVMAITDIRGLRSPPITEGSGIKGKVRQFLSIVLKPQDDSLKIFERTRTTYLTHQPI